MVYRLCAFVANSKDSAKTDAFDGQAQLLCDRDSKLFHHLAQSLPK